MSSVLLFLALVAALFAQVASNLLASQIDRQLSGMTRFRFLRRRTKLLIFLVVFIMLSAPTLVIQSLDMPATTEKGRDETKTPEPEPTSVASNGGIKIATAKPRFIGRIAYSSAGDIFVIDSDGRNQKRLTEGEAWDKEPAWSPDGSRIAYASNNDVYVMNSDGTAKRKLTNGVGTSWDPSWSPDGQYIAYEGDKEGHGKFDIYVLSLVDGELINLTNSPTEETSPAWSPDGTRIIFTSQREGRGINEGDLYIMNVDGSDLKNLTDNNTRNTFASWSPDGRYIAFTSSRDGNLEIYVMQADGKHQSRLTTSFGSGEMYPSWSPDGTQIAYVSDIHSNWQIYVMDADGQNQRRLIWSLGHDSDPAWAPSAPPMQD